MASPQFTRRDFLRISAATGAVAALFSEPSKLLGGLVVAAQPAPGPGKTQVIPGRCHECHVQCGMLVHIRDGRVLKVEGDPKFVNRGALCAKGQATVKNLYSPERLNYPFKRTRPKGEDDPGWVRISWEEALSTIAAKVHEVRAKHGPHAIAVGQGTGRYTVAHHARLKNSIESPNAIAPGHVCRGPMAAVTLMCVGHYLRGNFGGTACQVYWGRNEVWSHAGWSGGMIMDNLVDRKSKLIVIDPRFEHPLAHKADVYLPVRPGSDGALMLSWIHVIQSEGLYDREFVTRWTNGPVLVRTDTMQLLREAEAVPGRDARDFAPYPDSVADRSRRPTLMVWDTVSQSARPLDAPGVKPALTGAYTVRGIPCKPVLQLLADRAALYPPEKAAEICWSGSAEKIRAAARLYARSPSACTDVGSFGFQGIEGGHTNTFQTIRALVCLAALTGNINRSGGEEGTPSWTWIAGQWKREGGPRTIAPWGAPNDDFEVIMEGPHPAEPALNQFPLQPGMPAMLDSFRAMRSGLPYPIKVYVMVQGNPLGGWCEDQKTVRDSLMALEFLADMDLYVTPTNSLADIILPAGLGPFERGKHTLIGPMFERWPDEKFYVELGRRLNPRMWSWRDEDAWWAWKEEVEGENLGRAKAAGFPIQRGAPAPPLDYYKTLDPKTGAPIGFATPTGRIEIFSVIARQHGFDPLPDFTEPTQSPYSMPELAKQYPLVLTTGARLPVYYHSQHRNNPVQRELFPHPEVELNPQSAERFGLRHSNWVWIETKTGRIRMKLRCTPGLVPGVASMQHGWWQGCKELGLPGYDWDGANANVLVAGDAHDPALGVPGTRSQLCRIYAADAPPFAWKPPYYGTTEPAEYQGPRQYPEQSRRTEG